MYAYANSEENISFEIVPAVIPKAPWRVASVSHLPGFRLSVHFNDGTEGTVVMFKLIHSPNAGVFEVLRDVNIFKKVSLHIWRSHMARRY